MTYTTNYRIPLYEDNDPTSYLTTYNETMELIDESLHALSLKVANGEVNDRQFTAEISAIKGRLDTAENTINTIKTELATTNGKVSENAEDISTLQTQLVEQGTSIKNLLARVSALETAFESFKTAQEQKNSSYEDSLHGLIMAVAIGANAQYVTYNHDSPKMNQIMVEETGAGALTPELYYTLLHNRYKKTAAAKNKLTFRTAAGVASYQQVNEAEAIDSALTSRAKIEALNVADRQVDLAWLAEKDKVESQMRQFQKNIDRILITGGSPKEKERWSEFYHIYQCAIKATKDAYMPNAERKRQYLQIYADVSKQNDVLVTYLVQLSNRNATRDLLSVSENQSIDKRSIVNNALNRWNESRSAVRGSQDDSESDDGDGNESVNR